MVGSLHPRPIATLPFLAPHSAVVAFCEGVLKYATAWGALREDGEQKTGMTLEQARERLRSVLSLTDVTRFPIPKIPEAVIFVAATVSSLSFHEGFICFFFSFSDFVCFFFGFCRMMDIFQNIQFWSFRKHGQAQK